MKKLTAALLFLAAAFAAASQNRYETLLQQIETNNTTLAAMRRQTEAQKTASRTGLAPENPEIEFGYLWGNPSATGNRTDFSVVQTFDFPTAYAHRSKIAGLQNQNAELLYKAERMNLLLLAKQKCIELAYYNALMAEYTVRLQNAMLIASACKTRLDNGELNIMEYNKAQLNLVTVQSEVAKTEEERTVISVELKALNGGREFTDNALQAADDGGDKNAAGNRPSAIQHLALPASFDEWYATAESKNPALQYVRSQIEIGRQEIKLNRAMSLPKFSAGYMSEKTANDHFRGITVGVTIPLWENSNRIKQAKAQTVAAESAFEDGKVQFYNRLQAYYHRAVAMQQRAQKIRSSLAENNNEPLLKKALDAGEISLLDYLLEIEFYYSAVNSALEAERDFELEAAKLYSVTDCEN